MRQPLIIPIKESGQLYQLVEDYEIDLTPYGYHSRLLIPKGFIYDGASVPRWWWSISGLSRDGIHRAAALVHDYIYELKGDVPATPMPLKSFPRIVKFKRKAADQIFRDMLKDVAVADHRVWLAYVGVRAFGGLYWDD